MGYFCILISLLAGATKGFMGKKISSTVSSYRQAAFINVFRMFICMGVSGVSFMFESLQSGLYIDEGVIIYGALSGITLSFFIITWLLAVRNGAFMLVSVSQMFGTVITLLCSFFVFRKPLESKQLLAVALLVVAVLIMVSYSSGVKGKLSVFGIVMLVLCGLSGGINDFSMKLFREFSEANISMFNLISYIFSMVVLAVAVALPSEDKFNKRELLKSDLLAVIIMSVCLFVHSYFKAMANDYLSVAQVYPISQAGGLILSALMSSVFFNEKITFRCVVGLILAFIAVLLLK
ncbi:MAG: EamA family transporter [Oscillospiraceae bacterium]|nr:EamA family transporter [Oscillospiraceae bacterium]